MSELMKVAKEFEFAARKSELYASVVIYGEGLGSSVHVNSPPANSGFEAGKPMSAEEFIQRAKAFLAK